MSTSLRTAIVIACVWAASAFAGQDRQLEPDLQRDLRLFYERTGGGSAWIDARGAPVPGAYEVLRRLRESDADGLVPDDYDVDGLEQQAAALSQSTAASVDDARRFDVGLTAAVLKYFRELHLGRVDPRALGFHLDHPTEPHDFPEHLRAALVNDSFDRVVAQLRPAFAQYGGLMNALAGYRDLDPVRARTIELAMERMRWLPDVNGQRLIVVNIPMFHLWGWNESRENGVPAIGMAAIIGRAGVTKTPIFTSPLTSIVLNPDWTVPESIFRNEIAPKIAADSTYLAQNHMVMTTIGSRPLVRQLPGPWNALGQIKFVMPNEHDVYLHGTPAQELFSRRRRDFSHGCVRLENPLALASWVLEGEPDWALDRIRAVIELGTTRVVKVSKPPRVVLFYMTAAVSPTHGVVHFADDIYGHDARLEASLRTRAETRRR